MPPPTRTCRARFERGRFREDLYFRLNVIPIFVPPLRDRDADIPLLASHFMEELAREYGRRPKRLDAGAAAGLRSYQWPGNVRELRNMVERLMIMVPGETITMADLAFLDPSTVAVADTPGAPALSLHDARERFERDYILRALAAQQGNMSRTAEALGVERSNLYRKMRAFGIVPARRDRGRRRGGRESRRIAQAVFENLIGTEARELQIHVPRLDERRRRYEPDDLALEHRHAVSRGFPLDRIEYIEHRRVLVVRQVHRYLDEPAMRQPEPGGLDVA